MGNAMNADGASSPPSSKTDGTESAASPPFPEDTTLESERVATLEDELAQMRDRWMRSEAEIANVRLRAKRDVEEAHQYAVQKFATDVVEAAENLRRGLDSLPLVAAQEPANIASLRSGLVETERGFVGLLERNGIKREDPTGSVFDPNRHQAMAEQEDGDRPAGTVLHTLSPAWTLNGRLLRPAMVVVAKARATTATPVHINRSV
jgi:molecular chaperone GrpE